MRNRFTRAFFAASAAAVVTVGLAAGAGIASASTHSKHVKKETSSCGFSCTNPFFDVLGSSATLNAYVAGDNGTGGKVGQDITVKYTQNNRPNGDFIQVVNGEVWQFCGFYANDFFSPTSYICVNYPFNPVEELDWSPYGNESGLCVGVAAARAGQNVTLRNCGVDARTAWVVDIANNSDGSGTNSCLTDEFGSLPIPPNDTVNFPYCPWLSGADTQFSDPLVMTVELGSHHPANQVKLQRELFQGGSSIEDEQLIALYDGAAP